MSIQIKICGITTPETLQSAVDNGARFIGFVFFDKSPRNIAPADAAELSRMLPAGVRAVGLFVDPSQERLTEILGAVPLDMIQLHGSETPQRVAEIKEQFHMPIIKAFNIEEPDTLNRVTQYNDYVDWFIFDAPAPNPDIPGGSGEVFDWGMLIDKTFDKPWMLSGGLNANNVQQALETLTPDGVDVSSGVESAKGIKDTQRIEKFIKAVKTWS